jgi:hypothetical protein
VLDDSLTVHATTIRSLWHCVWEPSNLGRLREGHRKFLYWSPPAIQSTWLSPWIFSILRPIWWGNINQVRQVLGEKLTKSDLMYTRSDTDHPIVPTTPLSLQIKWSLGRGTFAPDAAISSKLVNKSEILLCMKHWYVNYLGRKWWYFMLQAMESLTPTYHFSWDFEWLAVILNYNLQRCAQDHR